MATLRRKTLKIMAAALLCVWLGSVAYCGVLTLVHGEEFAAPRAIGFDGMTTYGWEPNLRVMRYSEGEAVVYYFDQTKGQKVSFAKADGAWTFDEVLAAWSATGSADDYFLWPYWRSLVF